MSARRIPAWRPVQGSRASEGVVDQVRAALFAGLRPGDRLGTETDLAEQFGVSRLTVRDAVRTLEAQGIVSVKVGAGGGLRIAEGDPGRFAEALAVQVHLLGVSWHEIAEAMGGLEPLAARLAAERMARDHDDEVEARLSRLVAEQRAAMYDPHRFNEAASRFHLTIAETSGNRALYVAARALRLCHDRLLEPQAKPPVVEHIIAYHEALAEAVTAGDAERAERQMRTHLTDIATAPLDDQLGDDRQGTGYPGS